MGKYAWTLKYDPNQPRIPAGQSGGGRWTSGGGGVTSAMEIARSRAMEMTGPNLRPWERIKHFQERGIPDSAVKEMDDWLDTHGFGGEAQAMADKKIAEALKEDSPLGQALRAQMELETDAFKAWMDTKDARWKEAEDRLRGDWNFYVGEMHESGMMYDGTWYEDLDDVLGFAKFIHERDFDRLYRAGDVDKPLQAWTVYESGADVSPITGSYHITPTINLSGDQILEKYYPLAGFTTLVGAPGEGERLLVLKSWLD